MDSSPKFDTSKIKVDKTSDVKPSTDYNKPSTNYNKPGQYSKPGIKPVR